jgi:hypothetical protein
MPEAPQSIERRGSARSHSGSQETSTDVPIGVEVFEPDVVVGIFVLDELDVLCDEASPQIPNGVRIVHLETEMGRAGRSLGSVVATRR